MLACMKGVSSFGAIIILIVGLAMTGVTIYGFFHSEIFLDDTQQRNTILGIMIIADVCVLLGAILGICGLKRGNAFLICVFQIFVIFFTIVFFGLGIATEVYPGQFFQGNCTTSTNPTIQLANKVVRYSDQYFCQSQCECSLFDSTIQKYYTVNEQALLMNLTSRNPMGSKSTQDCNIPNHQLNDTQKRMAVAFGEIQDILKCTGWCDQGTDDIYRLFYRFSNVNNGKPEGYCYSMLQSKVFSYSHIIGLAAFITAGFLLLICAINICICFHPSRKGLSMKDRFVYMRNGQYARV